MIGKLSSADTEKYVNITVGLLLLLYSNYFTPELPSVMQPFIENDIVRVSVIAYMLYMGTKDMIFSIAVAIILVLLTKMMVKKEMENYEMLEDQDDELQE